MVKTRRHSEPKRNRQIPEVDFADKVSRSVEDLITRCQELTQNAVVQYADSYELSTSSFDVCPTCSNGFDYSTRDPICLPCGHTVCRHCITQLRSTSTRGICPYDRKEFSTLPEALTVNFAIRSMIDSKTKIIKRLCKRHKKELIGFGPDGQELLCGVCLFEKKGQVCFPFTSEQAQKRSHERKCELEAAITKINTDKELWIHCQEITELTTEPLRKMEEALETQPLSQLLVRLQQQLTQLSAWKQTQQADLEKLLAGWDALSFPEKLSLRLVTPDEVSLATVCMEQITALLKASR